MIVDVDGVPVFVETAEGPTRSGAPPLILLHGAGMDHTAWRGLVPALTGAGHRVLAVDLPGHGRSGGFPPSGIEAMADVVERVASSLDLERPVVVGHSMGSLVALTMAGRDRAGAIALLGAAYTMPVHPDLLAAAQAGERQAVDLILKWSRTRSSEPATDTGAGSPGDTRRMLEAGLRRSLATDLESCAAFTPERLADVDVPALVIVGDDDKMAPPSGGLRLAEAIADSTIRHIPAGHFALLDAPDLVAEVLVEWLGEIFPNGDFRS